MPDEEESAHIRVPFNDLATQWREIKEDVLPSILDVFERGTFSHGPEVEAFEEALARYLDAPEVVAVNSGTSALHLAFVVAGIGPGDEVIVPAHTFIATVWGLLYAGAQPVFCDVDGATGTIDVAHADMLVSARTKAIVPVHLFGQPAAMDMVIDFAARHNLTLIEDAAQAIGARWSGRCVGAIAPLGCLSFYPGKNLGAAGEGGAVIVQDAAVAARLRSLRSHGQRERYVHSELGFNYRMDGLQGLVLREKLRHLDQWSARRRELAGRYLRTLADLPLDLPAVVNHDHVWHLFVVRTPHRDRLHQYLAGHYIETGLHYPVPLHKQPCFAHLEFAARHFPRAERWASEGLSLPLFYGMTDAQLDHVAAAVHGFFRPST